MNNDFIGALGLYPIEEIITNTSNDLIYFTYDTSNNIINYVNNKPFGAIVGSSYNYRYKIDGANNSNAIIYADKTIEFQTSNDVIENRINDKGYFEILLKYDPSVDNPKYYLIETKYGVNGVWKPIREIFMEELWKKLKEQIDNFGKTFNFFTDIGNGLKAIGLALGGGVIGIIGGYVGGALSDALDANGGDENKTDEQYLNYILITLVECINQNSNNIRLTSNYAIETSNILSNRISSTSNQLAGKINTDITAVYSHISDLWKKDDINNIIYNDTRLIGIGTSIVPIDSRLNILGNVLLQDELRVKQKAGIGTTVIQADKILDVKGDVLFEDNLHVNSKISTNIIETTDYIQTQTNLIVGNKVAINRPSVHPYYYVDVNGGIKGYGSNFYDNPISSTNIPILNNILAKAYIRLNFESDAFDNKYLRDIVSNTNINYDNVFYDIAKKLYVGAVNQPDGTGYLLYYGNNNIISPSALFSDNDPISVSFLAYKSVSYGIEPSGIQPFYTTLIWEGGLKNFTNDKRRIRILFRRTYTLGSYFNDVVIQYNQTNNDYPNDNNWADAAWATLDDNSMDAFMTPRFYTFNFGYVYTELGVLKTTASIYINGVLGDSRIVNLPNSWSLKINKMAFINTVGYSPIDNNNNAKYRFAYVFTHKLNFTNNDALQLYNFISDKFDHTIKVLGSIRTTALHADTIYQDGKPVLWSDTAQNIITTSNNLQAQINTKEPLINLGTTQYALINDINGKVSVNNLITKAELDTLNNINTNFLIQDQIDSKLNKSGFSINRVLITDLTGNIVVSPNISDTELNQLDGTTFNINTNNTNTSNWIANLRDNFINTSNWITGSSNEIINYINNKPSSVWASNLDYTSYNNVWVYPNQIRIINSAGLNIDTYLKYLFTSEETLTEDAGTYNRDLTNYNGSYELNGGKNSILLQTNDYAIIPSDNWSLYTNLSIAGWFKTTNSVNNDILLDFSEKSEGTIVKYPPIALSFTNKVATLSNRPYGNGQYTINWSLPDYIGGFLPTLLFDGVNPTAGGGHFATNQYNSSTGNYTGPNTNFIVAAYLGCWVRLTLPDAIFLTSIKIYQRSGLPARSPKEYKLYGSNDLTNWTELIYTTNASYSGLVHTATSVNQNNSFTTFALVVNKIIGPDTILNFDELEFYGYTTKIIKGLSIKKVNTNLSFRIDDIEIYNIPYALDNTWTHILWNIKNATNTPFIRISTTSQGTEQGYTYSGPSSGIYINQLGNTTNTGSINIADFRIFTIPLTTTIKNDTYAPVASYTTLVDDAFVNTRLLTKQDTITGAASTITTNNLTASRVLISDQNGKVSTSNNIDLFILENLNGTTTNINTNFINTSNWVAFLRDNKLNKSGFTANRILMTDASGNIITTSAIDTTELGYLDGTTQNINTNFTNTSNWVKFLRDNKQNTLTAGTGITITDNTISASSQSQWITNGSSIYYNSGSVGIGTITPNRLLHIHNPSTTGIGVYTLYNDGSTTAGSQRGTLIGKDPNNNSLIVNWEINKDIVFNTSITQGTLKETMRIKSTTDEVVIQGTNPTLKIIDTRANNGNAIIELREVSDLLGADVCYIGNTDNRFYIRTYSGVSTPNVKLSINRDNYNIGIGTNNPLSELHLHNAVGTSQDVYTLFTDENTTSSITRGSLIGKSQSHDLLLSNYENAHIIFSTTTTTGSSNERLRITSGGNVCIGTNSPTFPYLVDINGKVNIRNTTNITSDLYVGGNIGVGVNPSYKLDITGDMRCSGICRAGSFRVENGPTLEANDAHYGNWKISSAGKINGWNGIRFTEADISLMAGVNTTKEAGFHYNGVGWALYLDSNRNCTINGRLTNTGSVKANQYFCVKSNVPFSSITVGGVATGGCFILTNPWWDGMGFSHLNICITARAWDTTVLGHWCGRAYLSQQGGILSFHPDTTTGVTISSIWDDSGGNYIRILAGLALNNMDYKIYG